MSNRCRGSERGTQACSPSPVCDVVASTPALPQLGDDHLFPKSNAQPPPPSSLRQQEDVPLHSTPLPPPSLALPDYKQTCPTARSCCFPLLLTLASCRLPRRTLSDTNERTIRPRRTAAQASAASTASFLTSLWLVRALASPALYP